jgi:hypothetical protein
MITLKLPDRTIELFDAANNMFVDHKVKGGTFRFEHSLRSITKWESKYTKPFLSDKQKTNEELLDYFEMMSLDGGFNREALRNEDVKALSDYIQKSQTATVVRMRKKPGSKSSSVTTSEQLYYNLAAAQIPWEADRWHISRLDAILKIATVAQNPKEKMSPAEIMRENARLNAERKAKLHTKG